MAREFVKKILWSTQENPDDYIIQYYDRVEDKLISLPANKILPLDTNPIGFDVHDEELNTITIPHHRIRRFLKNRNVVWERRK